MEKQVKQIKNILLAMVKAIATVPDEVAVHVSEEVYEEKEHTLFNIGVAKQDIPICIGQKGMTAEAIRRIAFLTSKNVGYEKAIFVKVDAPKMPKNFYHKD